MKLSEFINWLSLKTSNICSGRQQNVNLSSNSSDSDENNKENLKNRSSKNTKQRNQNFKNVSSIRRWRIHTVVINDHKLSFLARRIQGNDQKFVWVVPNIVHVSQKTRVNGLYGDILSIQDDFNSNLDIISQQKYLYSLCFCRSAVLSERFYISFISTFIMITFSRARQWEVCSEE